MSNARDLLGMIFGDMSTPEAIYDRILETADSSKEDRQDMAVHVLFCLKGLRAEKDSLNPVETAKIRSCWNGLWTMLLHEAPDHKSFEQWWSE